MFSAAIVCMSPPPHHGVRGGLQLFCTGNPWNWTCWPFLEYKSWCLLSLAATKAGMDKLGQEADYSACFFDLHSQARHRYPIQPQAPGHPRAGHSHSPAWRDKEQSCSWARNWNHRIPSMRRYQNPLASPMLQVFIFSFFLSLTYIHFPSPPKQP